MKLFLSILALGALFLLTSTLASAATTQILDSYGDVGSSSSIGIDSNNKIHIAYYDKTNNSLKYITNSSETWVSSILDNNAGLQPALALDSKDKVHIVYYSPGGAGKYITNASGSWVSTIIIGANSHLYSIALDSNDKVHIAYKIETPWGAFRDLGYITNASGSWVSTVIDTYGNTGTASSIAVDSNNKIHISYSRDDWQAALLYATNASGSWTSTVLASGDNHYHSSISLDKDNNVHIAYSYSIPITSPKAQLKYTTNVSGSWVHETISYPAYHGVSMVLDSDNKAHIAYSSTSETVKYLTNTSGSWISEIVSSRAGPISVFTSPRNIGIDSYGKVHISYYDSINRDLMYFTTANYIINVQIDIKPGSYPNAINPDTKGKIPVAILSTPDFNALTVNFQSVVFNTNEVTEAYGIGHIEDVDNDGDLDVVFHFNTQDVGIKQGDVSGTLTGETLDGYDIIGVDSILVVGK